eukprot:5799086-Amphidinium_carterae.1
MCFCTSSNTANAARGVAEGEVGEVDQREAGRVRIQITRAYFKAGNATLACRFLPPSGSLAGMGWGTP